MMKVLKSIRFIHFIALIAQGLFFSFSASGNIKDRISLINDSEILTRTPFTSDNNNTSESPFPQRGACDPPHLEKGVEGKLRYEQARLYTERGLVDLAIPELKRAIVLYPDDVESHAYLGWAYSQKGLISEAVKEFEKVLKMNPDFQRMPFDYPMARNIPAVVKEFTTNLEDFIDTIDGFSCGHEMLGLCYVLQGRLGDALNEYKKALKLESNYGGVDSLMDEKEKIIRIEQAIDEYEEVLRSKPDFVEAYSRIACAYARKGMLDQSIANMKKAMSVGPERVETHVYLGCFYAKKWMLDEALKELSAAKKGRDATLENLLMEGERCIHACMFDKAVSVAKEAIVADPGNKKAQWLLAVAYSKNGELDEAVEICKSIIRSFPDDICAYTLLGWIYVQCDLIAESMDLAEQAVLHDPENPEILALMAFLYASQNHIHEAIAMCSMVKTSVKDYGWVKGKIDSIEQKVREVKDVLEIKPDYKEAYLCLGWLHSKNGELERAIAVIKKAIEFMPDSYNTHLCLGNMYVQKGEIKDALNEYYKASEILSGKVQDEVAQGLISFKNGDIEQAITCFINALKMNPNYGEAYFFLADAYEKKGLYSVGMVLRSHGERIKGLYN